MLKTAQWNRSLAAPGFMVDKGKDHEKIVIQYPKHVQQSPWYSNISVIVP